MYVFQFLIARDAILTGSFFRSEQNVDNRNISDKYGSQNSRWKSAYCCCTKNECVVLVHSRKEILQSDNPREMKNINQKRLCGQELQERIGAAEQIFPHGQHSHNAKASGAIGQHKIDNAVLLP